VTVQDLIDKLKKVPKLGEIQDISRVVRDDGTALEILVLCSWKRDDGTIGQEHRHYSLGGFSGVYK
jgi:hypothetical protein